MTDTRFYSVKEVAELLGYSRQQIYNFIKSGRLGFYRPGKGKILIADDDLLLFIKRGRNEQLVLATQLQKKD